jgi:energy-coupling factor transporter ATP-binding protein EcfA2
MTLKPHHSAYYFNSLTVENVRAFGPEQHLDLSDKAGNPASWTLLLGENGVGKTTLLQCLARMFPFPAFKNDTSGEKKKTRKDQGKPPKDQGEPKYVEAELLQHDNEEIERFFRFGSKVITKLAASISTFSPSRQNGPLKKRKLNIAAEFNSEKGVILGQQYDQVKFTLPRPGPLVIGYGAARHIGHANRARIMAQDPTVSLFRDSMDLYDAEDILADLRFAALDSRERASVGFEGRTKDESRLSSVLEAVAALLPDDNFKPSNIDIKGPKVPGRKESETGVQIKIDGTVIPLRDLSIGYQTMLAWTVDLAWRLYEWYPLEDDPMRMPAVVLIDEVDLHLHPRWQRKLRGHLTEHFPGVQFIATTHSPITAQEALASGAGLCVVRTTSDGSEIINDPIPVGEWRLDQVVTSDLFGFISARSQVADQKLEKRRQLISKIKLTPEEKTELERLDQYALNLPVASSPKDQQFADDLRSVAERIKNEDTDDKSH